MKPKKLHSAGLKRGAALPAGFRRPDASGAWMVMREVFAPRVVTLPLPAQETALTGPMDLDVIALEAMSLEAAGIPPELLLGYDRTDSGQPIPGGGAA